MTSFNLMGKRQSEGQTCSEIEFKFTVLHMNLKREVGIDSLALPFH